MRPNQLKRDLENRLADVIDTARETQDGRLEFDLSDRTQLADAVSHLRDAGITHLITITGVDADTGETIEVLYHFLRYGEFDDGDLTVGVELTLRVSVPTDDPTIETITDQIPAAGLYERELMDMLGVEVTGHPNPEPLLLPDDYDGGPPLRAENLEVSD